MVADRFSSFGPRRRPRRAVPPAPTYEPGRDFKDFVEELRKAVAPKKPAAGKRKKTHIKTKPHGKSSKRKTDQV